MAKAMKHYRIQNWSDYNQPLISRESITFWISEDAAQGWQNWELFGKRAASNTYSDLAIVTSLMIRSL